jgi:hypothetical protein
MERGSVEGCGIKDTVKGCWIGIDSVEVYAKTCVSTFERGEALFYRR